MSLTRDFNKVSYPSKSSLHNKAYSHDPLHNSKSMANHEEAWEQGMHAHVHHAKA